MNAIWMGAIIFAIFAIAEAWRGSFLSKVGQRGKDATVEVVGGAILVLVTQPLIVAAGALLGVWWLPGQAGVLGDIPIWAQLGLLLIFDDMFQYWWHRLSHTVPRLYQLHRAHHDAPYMSVRIMYRNNVFYYALMPSLWASGVLIYLGLGPVYAVYLTVKLLVIAGAHSDVQWDAPLYRWPVTRPLMWLVERVISTPATHSAHHGRHLDDGATHYKGNFGNLLFFWDVLFGTAKITRRYPASYGVENLAEVSAGQQLFWPFVPAPRSSVRGAVAPNKPRAESS